MARVKREYFLSGSTYSQNKVGIKALFKKHKINWGGTMDFPMWKNDQMKVIAQFLRENDVTVGAKLIYEGEALTPFCQEFTKLLDALGAEYNDTEVQSTEEADEELTKELDEQIKIWERVNRPNVEIMRKGTIHNGYRPVPEVFINAALNDYKEKRDAYLKKLMEELKKKM